MLNYQKESSDSLVPTTHTQTLPMVTVIMPVRNEADFIARSLGAVIGQDYPPQLLEVIVTDGMSIDGTREIVSSLQTTYHNLRLVDNPGRIVPTGINAAMDIAKGQVIVRIDGHCEIAPDYVSRCVEHLQKGEADGVGGPIETVGQTYLSRVIACAMSSNFGVGGSAFRTGTQTARLTDTVAFPAYTRAITERAGPYDEELVRNQDDEYNYRIRKLGGRLILAPDVKCRYFSRSSLRSLSRQYFQYGYWKVRVLQKHPLQMRARQFVPLLFIMALLLSAGLSLVSPLAGWAFVAVAGSYIAANICASCLTAIQRDSRLIPVLPIAFAAVHFSYGLGNIFGLVRFAGNWRKPAIKARVRTSDVKG